MKDSFIKKIDGIQQLFINLLNQYQYSKILQEFLFSRFQSVIYSVIIENFFSNLIETNAKECDFPIDQISILRSKYKFIQDEVKSMDDMYKPCKEIGNDYYEEFKKGVRADFPLIRKFLSEFEREINYIQIRNYLRKQKKIFISTGNKENSLDANFSTKLLEVYIQRKNALPLPSSLDGVASKAIQESIIGISKDWAKTLKINNKEVLFERRQEVNAFEERLNLKWQEPIDLLESLIGISLESVERHLKVVKKNDVQLLVLTKTHARSLHIANEILALLKKGYADGAFARWRSLHELTVVSLFLKKYGVEVSQRYLDHDIVRKYKEASAYQTHCKELGYRPLSKRELNFIEKGNKRMCEKYKDKFQDEYGWIPSSIIKVRHFKALEEHVSLDALRPYYNLSCNAVHGSIRGLYRLGLGDSQNKILLVGPSNYGLADPFQNTAYSLVHITSCLLAIEPRIESLIAMHMLSLFASDIAIKATRIQRGIEKDERLLAN